MGFKNLNGLKYGRARTADLKAIEHKYDKKESEEKKKRSAHCWRHRHYSDHPVPFGGGRMDAL